MKRLLLALSIILVVVIGGAIAAIVTLNSIDWSQYKEPIAAAVKKATGRTVTIDGDIKLNISLSPGVSVRGLVFENAEWGSQPSMLQLEQAEVHLQLVPLIFGNVEVNRLELRGLDLLLETDASGKGNWQFELEDAASAIEEPAAQDGTAFLGTAILKRTVIENANIAYINGETGERQAFSIDAFEAMMASNTAPLEFELAARMGELPIGLAGRLTGAAGLVSGDRPLGLDLSATLPATEIALVGSVGQPLEAAGIDVKVRLKGESLSQLLSFFDVEFDGLNDIDAAAKLVGDSTALAIEDLVVDLDVAGSKVSVAGSIGDGLNIAGIALQVRAQGPSFAALSGVAGTQLPDAGRFEFAADVLGNASKFDLKKVLLVLGGSRMNGQVTADIGSEPMRINASIDSPRIDLTKILPQDEKPDAEKAPADKPAAERVFPDTPLPLDAFEALDSINASVSVNVGELVIDPETTLTRLKLQLDASPGKVRVQNLNAETMDGSVAGNLSLDVAASSLGVRSKLRVTHPSLGNLLKAQDNLMLEDGPVDIDLDIRGAGASVAAIMATLNGNVAMTLGKARIKNDWAKLAMADLTKSITGREKSDGVDLNCVVADFSIAQGIATPSSLVVDTPALSLFGEGNINLRNEGIKLNFDRLASGVTASGILPPFKLRGSLASPKGEIDAGALAKKAVGFGAALLTKSEVQRTAVEAQSGPERCRQRLVAYQQVKKDRGQSTIKALENSEILKDGGKEAIDRLKGIFGRGKNKDQDAAE